MADSPVHAVTGGGSGIGAGVSRELAAGGASVVVLDRNLDAAEAVAEEVGGTARQLDVTDEEAVERVYAELGPIAGAVNCAGFSMLKPIVGSTLEDWHRMTSVHLDGTFLCLRAAASSMLMRGVPGSIVNIASVNAQFAHRGLGAYSAAKAGIVMLTRVAALELAGAGIRVNAVAPGMVVTGMNRARFDDEDFTRTWTASMPLGRVAYPVDIAKVVAFLVGPDSGWVTGQTIGTDGGVSLRVEPKIFADEQWTRPALAQVVVARQGSRAQSTDPERSAAR
jgi:NAD(P)-dependent dehydrogenase (short-subunit alcohol dehydrogenase family)